MMPFSTSPHSKPMENRRTPTTGIRVGRWPTLLATKHFMPANWPSSADCSASHFCGRMFAVDAKVLETIQRLERFMETVNDALALPREAAEFVHALVLARGARRAVEIGTSYGYSGLWIGAALARNEGTLITIDHDSRKSDEARSNFT